MTTGNGDTDTPVWSFWIDRGGTFTDVIGRNSAGRIQSLKLLSASDAYDDAAVEGMRQMLGVASAAPFPADRVDAIKMGTTVATNALLERKGAHTLFITTKGFADALVIGDQTRPALFALSIEKPAPLYAGVVEARERLDAAGAVLTPLDRAALAEELRAAVANGFTSAAIAFLHADLNPAHEISAGEIAREAGFDFVALSHQVSPLPRFIPRAETTVADAYLTPVVQAYAQAVQAHKLGHRVDVPGLEMGTRGLDLSAQASWHLTEGPGGAAGRGDADRAVAILHGGVGLGPELRRLAQLERRFLDQADAPAAADEGDLFGVDQPGQGAGLVLREHGPGVGDGRRQVLAERGAQERQRGRGDAGLDHRLFVDLAEQDGVGRQRGVCQIELGLGLPTQTMNSELILAS